MTSTNEAFAFELSGVGRTFRGKDSSAPAFNALSEVDLAIPAGSLTTIVGPSGSGKSTLLGILGLLDRPTVGELSIDGRPTAKFAERHRVAMRASHLGFVFQSFHLMPERTVLDNVMLGGIYRGLRRTERAAQADGLLHDVGLESKRGQKASLLSGGERQRVAIARALVGQPKILLCDEPTGNLDSKNGELIIGELTRLVEHGITVVIVTHDPAIANLGTFRVAVKDGLVTSVE